MKAIWKFPLKMELRQTIDMPFGRRILSCGTQLNNPWPHLMVWAEVDTEEKRVEPTVFTIIGTGRDFALHQIPDYAVFLGTVVLHAGSLVAHIYYHQT